MASLEEDTPRLLDSDQRIMITARCRDADCIVKVPGAGTVHLEPDGTRVQLMHNGLKVVADGYSGPWMTRLIQTCQGHHEPQEELLFHQVLRFLPADATMIELGGYWSFYSLWFLNGFPQRRAFVLEPDPEHLTIGRRNAELNGLSPIFMEGYAGPAPLPPAPFRTEVSGVIDLPCLSVPQIMQHHGLDRLTVLHCDAQGAELGVVESCEHLFRAGRIQWLIVSTHAYDITGDPLTHQRCLAALHRFGAVVEAEHDVHESFSGDGLIVARFGPPPPGWMPVSISRNRYSESLFRNPLYDLAERMQRPPDSVHLELTIKSIFAAILMRPPQLNEIAFFCERIASGATLTDIVKMIFSTVEFAAIRHDFIPPAAVRIPPPEH